MPNSVNKRGAWSLRNRQLVVLTASLTLVAMVLWVGGAYYISSFTQRTSDRLLGTSANSIAETVTYSEGEIDVEIPPVAFGMLNGGSQNNVYYSVHHGSRLVTGYRDLSPPSLRAGSPSPSERIQFRDAKYLNQDIRVASIAVRLPSSKEPAFVQVGETLDTREDQTSAMLLRLLGLEVFLIIVAAALIGPAIKWGLHPLTLLERKIARVKPEVGHNTPLDLDDVPAELHELVATFNGFLARLDASTMKIRDFTADASHQLRTPLTTLRTHLMLLRRDRMRTEEGEIALIEVEGAAERMRRLLTQLLSLARSDDLAAHPELSLGGTPDIAAEVGRVVSELAPHAVKKNITIEVQADKTISVTSHPTVIDEVVTNLVDNAILYSEPDGTITVSCGILGNFGTITVQDNGPGIPEHLHEPVFQRFFRLQRDGDVPGSGLGLPIVQTMVTTVGGSVELSTPECGKGLAVIVRLPLAVQV